MSTLTNPQILSVYKTAAKAIHATARRYGTQVSEDTVADLQQGTLIKVISKYDASRGVAPDAMAWRVAANEATDYLRGRLVSAIKNNDVSLTVEDEDGDTTISDLADDSANPFELIAARQLDAEITCAIADLSEGMQAGISGFYNSDEETMTGGQRIAKMRAVEALSESLKASHFANIKCDKKAKKVKAPKRAKVETAETVEAPGLLKLATQSKVDYEVAHCLEARLMVG